MALRPKSTVRYRMGGAHCGLCSYFVEGQGETGSCKLVEGEIGEDMLCDLFKRKGPASAPAAFAAKANVY